MKNRYALLSVLLLISLSTAGCVAYATGHAAGPAPGPPPPGPPSVVISQPEFLFMMPNLGIYFYPGVSFDLFFYDGLWYYSARGVWYWGRNYRGPWYYMRPDRLPSHFRRLPPDYHTRYRQDHYRVPYGHWEKRRDQPPPRSDLRPPGFLYKLPNTRTYAYPGVPDEIFFNKDRWYKRYNNVWYWSWSYNGPWAYMQPERVPKQMRNMPRQRFDRDDRYERIPWEKGKNKWNGEWEWERERD